MTGAIGVAVLGSTGSIGQQALEVLAAHADRFRVVALAVGRASDARFTAQVAAYPAARVWAASGRPSTLPAARWAAGGLEELATLPDVELVVVATTGMVALPATLAALGAGRKVALANKETLVAGGHLVTRALAAAPDRFERLRPIDSEHSAI
ncbi:MAG TPA: 1-deoxy-D-xylulose-5-phosphate reductoisomerase, partial [Candidatus Limnocylindria bacterium]|nr:1-deoxy-D-xylulose-5-phosphate reductoisomerase [Candidatus Limnocylindria bacterium]